MDTTSQKNMILQYLKTGKRINPQIALRLFHCMRLASRISDLRSEGKVIGREMIYEDDGTKYAEYWLETEENE